MKRPPRIYELLGKIADGTFLNDKEFREVDTYINDLEHLIPNCIDCHHSIINHLVVDIEHAFVVECYETDECKCIKPYSGNTEQEQSKQQ